MTAQDGADLADRQQLQPVKQPLVNRNDRAVTHGVGKYWAGFKRDDRIPAWHGWHSARRGLGSNLYRLGVPEKVIQRILRHANVSTTASDYIKTAEEDVRNAMAKLESHIAIEIDPGAEAPQEVGGDRWVLQ